MLDAFQDFYDLTNWDVIFRVFSDYCANDGFIYALYSIVDVRLGRLYEEADADKRHTEFQRFEHCAADYLSQLDAQFVEAHVYVLKLFNRFDAALDNLDRVWPFAFLSTDCWIFLSLSCFCVCLFVLLLLRPIAAHAAIHSCHPTHPLRCLQDHPAPSNRHAFLQNAHPAKVYSAKR